MLCLLLWAQGPTARAEATVATVEETRIEKLSRALRSDPSYQVRLQAAAVLGKLGDREAVPALVQALIEDKSELVRATCAEALGQLAADESRPALQAARSDPNPVVRTRAEAALSRVLAGAQPVRPAPAPVPDKRVTVAIGRMGSKARGAAADLPKLLREAITRELKGSPEVQLVEDGGAQQGGFAVESSVTELSQKMTATGQLEVSCEVSMVIVLMPSRSIVGMTSGGATIQAPRRATLGGKAARQALEMDALSNAVHGANQNLLAFLRNQK